jgi:HD-like signal output (HDOD) protein
LDLLSDPDLDMLHLIDLIEQTPALAARVMGVASSAFFRSAKAPQNVSDAVIRILGLDLVRDLLVSSILSEPFRNLQSKRFDPLGYWQRAMLTATLAQQLAPMVSKGVPGNLRMAYLGGLLHNLGMLALAAVAPVGTDEVFRLHEADPSRSLTEIQHQILGIDYVGAGATIAGNWGLPAPLTAVMSFHRDAQYVGAFEELVKLVHVADCTAKGWMLERDLVPHPSGLEPLLNSLGIPPSAWDVAIARWKVRVENIEELARTFVRGRS